MPTPGSHQYDIHRARRRKDLENSGVPDEHANEAANAQLKEQGEVRGTDPAKDTDRRLGPKSER